MIDYGAAARAAWGCWRRDAALLWPLAGLALFVPLLALALLLPPPPAPPAEATPIAQLIAQAGFFRAHLPLLAFTGITQIFGRLALFTLYRRPGAALGTALAEGLALLPRYLLVAFAVQFAVRAGLALLLVPGLYLGARLALTGPAFVAAPERPAFSALTRSWTMTRGHGLMLMALVAASQLTALLALRPFAALAAALPPGAPSIALVLLAGAQASIATLLQLAVVLYETALYRQLAGQGRGLSG